MRAMIQMIVKGLQRGWRGWSRFWFESDGSSQMRLFRLCLGLLLFFCYLNRGLDLEFYYSEQGLIPLSVLQELHQGRFNYDFLQVFRSNTMLWTLHWAFLGSLLALALGIAPRISAILSMILHLAFIHRNVSVAYGVDLISAFYLFYFCFADFRPRANLPTSASDLRSVFGSIAYRLCQLQLCVIYGYSGIHKLKGAPWWNGEAIWYVIANFQLAEFNFEWMSRFPMLIVISTFSTLIWEIYFPVLIWVPRIRYWVLGFGILLHLGIAFTVNIHFFGLLMILTYLLFLNDDHALAIEMRVSVLVRKIFGQSKVNRSVAEQFSV